MILNALQSKNKPMKRLTRMIYRAGLLLTAGFIAVGVLLATSTTAYAIDLPDSINLIDARAFQNLNETGDMLVVYHGKVNYDSYNGTYPAVPASSSIMLRFYADNGTLMASAAPYVYYPFDNNGYGDFVSAFYFDAASAPVWEGAHSINIQGVPSYYTPAEAVSLYKPLASSDYEDSADTAVNQENLYIYILSLCDQFKSIYTDVSLKSTTDVGTVLSAYGEAYFKSAIPGLSTLCPDLFYVQVYIPEVMPVTAYDESLADTMATHTDGGDIERGMTRLGTVIGVGASFMWGLLTFVGSLVICIYCQKKGWGVELGMTISSLLVILIAVLVGDAIFSLMMIVGLLATIGIMWVMFLRRA